MSTSWKGLSKKVKPSPSKSGEAYGIKPEEEKLRQLADTLIVNDLKPEYYYSQIDVALDAFRIHREFADKHPKLYVEAVKTLRPITLECQKVLAAAYLWDRNINRKLALELLGDVRPTWRMTFFYMFKKQVDEAGFKHKGWGRTLRKLALKLIKESSAYHTIKYKDKLLNLARWSHISADNPQSLYLFGDYKKSEEAQRKLEEADNIWKEYFTLKQIKDETELLKFLEKTRLPFTVLKGILGEKVNDPRVFARIVHTLTPWETILTLKQVEKRRLLDNKVVLETLMRKIKPETLQNMRIDIVELLQAYRKVEHPNAQLLLKTIIHSQISAVSEALSKYLTDKKVVVVFDVSGSMMDVAEWSLALALTISQVKAREVKLVAFADEARTVPIPTEEELLLEAMKDYGVGGGTALGKGLIEALKHTPDIIFFISDFEGNIEPWSDNVYKEYVKAYGKFPDVISIKFTTSPLTAIGELTAIRLGRWLGLGDKEYKMVIRNIWDLPTILEYIFHLLPILKKKAKQVIEYAV